MDAKSESLNIKQTVSCSVIAFLRIGIISGVIFSLHILYLGNILSYVKDSLLFTAYITAASVIIWLISGIVISFICGFVINIFKISCSRKNLMNFYIWFCMSFLLAFESFFIFFLYKRPLDVTEFSNLLIELLIVSLCALFSFVLLKILKVIIGEKKLNNKLLKPDLGIIFVSILFLCIAFLTSSIKNPLVSENNSNKNITISNTGLKVLLIGLDGATWHIADTLLKEGKLPNLKKIISNGSKGDLKSYTSPINPFKNTAGSGMFSSALWTSIATGKSPRDNGVQDLIMISLPGIDNPLPFRLPLTYNLFKLDTPQSFDIKTKRLWNIIGEFGKKCGVYGWWCTWPVEKINGIMVSIAATANNPLRRETSFYPPSINSEIKTLNSEFDDGDNKILQSYFGNIIDPSIVGNKRKNARPDTYREMDIKNALNLLMHDFKRDLYFKVVSKHFMKKNSDYDFTGVYFLCPDSVEHVFWKYYEPQYFEDVSEKDIEKYGKVIENYYKFLDEAVGDLYSLTGEDTITIIVSDHGMGPWMKNSVDNLIQKVVKRYQTSSGNHRTNGIIVVSGKNIKKTMNINNASLFDVVPTVLHLLGFPVAKDMRGKVLTDVIADEWLEKFPVSYIDSYEGIVNKEILPEVKVSDQNDLKRLKALGYIN